MNTFFYSLGKGAASTQHTVVQGAGNTGVAISDAVSSFTKGYREQRLVTRLNNSSMASDQVDRLIAGVHAS